MCTTVCVFVDFRFERVFAGKGRGRTGDTKSLHREKQRMPSKKAHTMPPFLLPLSHSPSLPYSPPPPPPQSAIEAKDYELIECHDQLQRLQALLTEADKDSNRAAVIKMKKVRINHIINLAYTGEKWQNL